MTHREFVAAYAAGRVRIEMDKDAAARHLSARLLLPFVLLPVLGVGVASALLGWVWTGLAIILAGIAASRLIKRSAPHFLLTQALEDANVYAEIHASGILRVGPADAGPHAG